MSTPSDWDRIHPIYGVPVAAEQSTSQPSIICRVIREGQYTEGAQVPVSTWINTDYFLWTLCAGLAASETDEQWTLEFETKYQDCWKEIQARVREVGGSYRFGLRIPAPPVFEVEITPAKEVSPSFKICAEGRPTHLAPPMTGLPRDGVWAFWKYLAEQNGTLPTYKVFMWAPASSFPPNVNPAAPIATSASGSVPPPYRLTVSPPPPYSR
ncbi:hypothetical protein N7541_007857 [Penicillium brevicompactum]|uniref:Uncharacterized protein n=1 Tax=Penicillium brevicompactum TaxID=5074 RepID=A0A9W9QZF0_PENBR|nr:hypothetical protein N7541_007857 [Penicillium brevicompactum]